MRVLITGSRGFLGRALTRAISERGHTVVGLDAAAGQEYESGMSLTRYERGGMHFNWHLTDGDMLWRVMCSLEPEQIFHLAANSDLRACQENPNFAVEDNVGGTANLLNSATDFYIEHRCAPFKIVIAGSGEEYGAGEPERYHPTAPRNIYGATKAAASQLAIGFYHSYGLPVSIARMATIYGPGQTGKFIPTVIERMLSGQNVLLHNHGRQMRDWLYVDDAISGLLATAEHGCSGEAYNLGGYEETTVGATANLIGNMLRSRGAISDYTLERVEQGNLSRRIRMNAADTRFQLRWNPLTPLVKGLEQTIDAVLAERAATAAA